MPFLPLNLQQQIFYEYYSGQAEHPCLIFLHEGLGSIAQWRDFPRQLCQRTACPALVYDRLGYGRSSSCSRPRSIHYLHHSALDELPQVINALIPGQRFILIGHSDGGSISLIFGAERPPLLLGISTLAAHVFVDQITIDGVNNAERSFRQGGLRQALARYHGDKTDMLFASWADTWNSPWFRTWNIEYLLPSIEVPLFVIQGLDDQYGTPSQVEAIVRQSAGPAISLLLANCGHSPHRDAPEQLLDSIASFVNHHCCA
jgi:pimeloyl-ACP methyl ester carboxylesterase